MSAPVRVGDGTQIVVEPPQRPAVKAVDRPRYRPTAVVPVPGPPGRDAEVVLEGEFNHTHEQTVLAQVWTFPNPLGRQITSCRVIYPTTPDGENVIADWNTTADGRTVVIDHKHPATGRAIIS